MNEFCCVSAADMNQRNIDQLDFILVTPDAYVDHPSFAMAILSRWLEYHGFRVGIISRPSQKDIGKLGVPKYAFLVSGGNIDGMVANYTVNKKRRSVDFYSDGTGRRPDRPTVEYTKMIRNSFGSIPVIIGGVEASLRRFAHYDYLTDSVLPSVLVQSGADLLSYGMGEITLLEIARCFEKGWGLKGASQVKGVCSVTHDISKLHDAVILSSFEKVVTAKQSFAEAFKKEYLNQDYLTGRTLVQQHAEQYLVQNPPQRPMTQQEFDLAYSLPYNRCAHPMYKKEIPALNEVKFSLVSSRGCFGGCSFCSINFHQGTHIQSRSIESLVTEATELTKLPDFKGNIHDVGGPTANFYGEKCVKQAERGHCAGKLCLGPEKCEHLKVDHSEYVKLLRALRNVPNVKHVFIRSGIRFDYAVYDKDKTFMRELTEYHISGQLKVAPEHISKNVLFAMGKPDISVFEHFEREFNHWNEKLHKKQYLIPYFISSHPGCTINDAVALAEYMRDRGFTPDQAQDFYPTPGTLSTCMYYTGIHPLTGKSVYVPKNAEEKRMQRALLQYKKPENHELVKMALKLAGREDLIGFGKKCLIPPRILAKHR